MSSKKIYHVTFEVDVSTPRGRDRADRLLTWLAKERYDCPDNAVAGEFNGILIEVQEDLDHQDRARRD